MKESIGNAAKGGKYFPKDVYTHLMRSNIPVMHIGDEELGEELGDPVPFVGNPSEVNCKLSAGIQPAGVIPTSAGAFSESAKYGGEPVKQDKIRFGRKDDNGKLRYDLVPCTAYRQLVEVLTVGAAKYGDENWKSVDKAERRYYAACLRHLESHRAGELLDQEDGKPHLAHAMCCVLFLLELQNVKGKPSDENGN